VGATTSEGDFPLLDDGRTAFDPSDDRQRPRENGFVREGVGLAHLDVPLAGGRLRAVGFGLSRAGGVPGVASRPTSTTRRRETHLLAGLAWERTEDGQAAEDAEWRVGISASGAFRRREFTDLDAEIGTPRDTEDDSVRAVARVAGAGRALDWLELSGVALYTHESLFASDRGQADDPSGRDRGTLGAEARLFGRIDSTRFDIRPSARVSAVSSRLTSLRPDRADNESFELAPTFRLGAALSPLPDVTIAASASSATRMPSMVELFGDRGVLVGDPSLRPERAESFDLGVALRGRHEALRGQAELRGFVTLASDLIRYARVDALRAVPQNVDQAVLGGAELGVRGSLTRHVSLRGALTLLATSTEHLGVTRQLPLRPTVSAYVRPEVRAFDVGPLSRVSAFVDLAFVSASFWDPANQGVLAERARFGAGLSVAVWRDRLRVDASVSDLTDARGTDRLGLPLPGRALWVSATLRSR
ncbi:MAG: TonB-dependent receptor, partial [Sandaracinaceae bacterium]